MTTPTNADAQKDEFGLQLCSLLTSSGELELTLEAKPIDTPAHNELVGRIEAPPVNPSDLGLLLGAADLLTAKTIGEGPSRQSTITLPAAGFRAMSGRVGQAMAAVGNEGAGVVIAAACEDLGRARHTKAPEP